MQPIIIIGQVFAGERGCVVHRENIHEKDLIHSCIYSGFDGGHIQQFAVHYREELLGSQATRRLIVPEARVLLSGEALVERGT